jgi:hypothetical protein
MFFKKSKIKFYCDLPEVMEKYPIIEARNYNFNWIKKSLQHFKNVSKDRSDYEQITSVVKCPGVLPIMKEGYIVQSWFDITIKSEFDQNRFEFFIPQGLFSYLKDRNYDKKLISWFSGEEPAHAIPMPEESLQSLIKITMPWSVSIPKGYKLIFMPVPYPESCNFTAVHGILKEGDFYHINAIIKVNVRNCEFKIPAGTPLFQLIPIKDEKVDIEMMHSTKEIKEKEIKNKYQSNHQFIIK